MTTQELQNLRKCTHFLDREYTEYYFHMWAMQGIKHLHPDDPHGDLIVAEPHAVLEECNTGKVTVLPAQGITFIT